MAHIIEHSVKTPIAIPAGYAIHAVMTEDDEIRYVWGAPDGESSAPLRRYRHLIDACRGAWWDDAHQRSH